MAGYTETGFLRISLDITTMGAMQKNQAQKIENDLLEFFKERKVNVDGNIQFVSINKLDVKSHYSNLDTTP